MEHSSQVWETLWLLDWPQGTFLLSFLTKLYHSLGQGLTEVSWISTDFSNGAGPLWVGLLLFKKFSWSTKLKTPKPTISLGNTQVEEHVRNVLCVLVSVAVFTV